MAMKRRSRIVSFRLSDEEYNSLKNVTESRGARSVSEFTRKVACNIDETPKVEKIEDALRTLNANMATLSQKLDVLTGALDEKNAAEYTDFTDLKNENKEQVK